jgi:hypothetical protein
VIALAAACTTSPVGSGIPTSAAATASTAPASTATASASTPFEANADGYRLSVTADRLTVAPGESVTFTATFHNGTDKPIDVAGCGDTTGLVSVALPTQPTGKSWSGIRQAFKDFVLKRGMGPGIVPALDPLQVNISGPSCAGSAISSELGPGKSLTSKMSWKAEIVSGVNALAGAVPFTVSVGYDQQNSAPSYPPDYNGPLVSWMPLFKALTVSGSVEVVGEGKALAGPGEIIDAALADTAFFAWLSKRPAKTWSNANLFLTSSPRAQGIVPKGPAWELDLFREIGVPRNWAIAFVDPFDASLISVHYCNVPCTR